ncbi:hypothetical protein CHCC15075_2229 [Bacillus licheniformis]|nr:hypothetical protein CHCC15075_2229 [Bacillus licheniformis]TWN38885.1 hypothetical protein CHCC14525_2823 [Bacillus licheniformis]
MRLSQLAKPFEEPFNRRYDAHIASDRFNDDACNVISEFLKDKFHAFQIIVRNGNRVFCNAFRNSGAVREAECRYSRARFNQQGITVSMVAAFKFYDFVTACVSARQPQGAHRRLRTGAHHPDDFYGRNAVDDKLGKLGFQFCRRTEACPVFCRLLNLFHHFFIAVAQNKRSP